MIWGLFAVAVILMCLTSTGFAQSTASERDNDAYYLGYYGGANMGLPPAEVNIVNPGSTGGYSDFDPTTPGYHGDLCANIYVFTSDQQMVECCSCFVSPNGLRVAGRRCGSYGTILSRSHRPTPVSLRSCRRISTSRRVMAHVQAFP